MPKEEWGVKRVCPTTGKRFYDLNKTPIVSPYTGEIVDIESSRRKFAAAASPVRNKVQKDEEDDTLVDDLDTEEDLLVEDESDDADLSDDLLEDDEDDTVPLDNLTDVSGEDEET